jgi:hypothetical protein
MKQSGWSQSFHADKLKNKLYSSFMDRKVHCHVYKRAPMAHLTKYMFLVYTIIPSTFYISCNVSSTAVPWIERFCPHLTAEALVKSQTIPYEICGRRRNNGTGSFSAYFGLSPVSIIQPSYIHNHLSVAGGILPSN